MSVLIVLTSHDELGATGRKTGVWLEEFLVPYYEFIDVGLRVRLASPRGGAVPIDPISIQAIEETDIFRRFAADNFLQGLLEASERIDQVDASAVDAVLYPGGHGPLYDLRTNSDSIGLIESILRSGKSVATICHAGCALLDAKTPHGDPLVKGRSVTAFSDSEEAAIQLETTVPYLVESELKRLGANYSKAQDWQAHWVQDEQLITGQNPASSRAVAKAIIDAVSIARKKVSA
jgi:putative intracellular protease/amidase